MVPPSTTTQTALVVGGSSGIGLAAAKTLHSKGFDIILVSSSDDKLAAAKQSFPAGPSVDTWQADLSAVEGWVAVVEKVSALPTNVHIKFLVNSAGVFEPKPFLDNKEDDYEVRHSALSTSILVQYPCSPHFFPP